MRYMGLSVLLHGLLAAVLTAWAPAVWERAAPAVVRVLLLPGEGPEDTNETRAEAGKPQETPAPPEKAARATRSTEAAARKPRPPAAPVSLIAEGPPGEQDPRPAISPPAAARLASIAPSAAGMAGGAPRGKDADRDRRIALIQERIQRALVYPREARRRGIEGTVHVRFDMRENGRVGDVAVRKSSGHRLLDRASVSTIRRAQPFPFVEGALEVPVVFRLTR